MNSLKIAEAIRVGFSLGQIGKSDEHIKVLDSIVVLQKQVIEMLQRNKTLEKRIEELEK